MGYETAYNYDNFGNVTTATNPSGSTTVSSHFNSFHQPGKLKDPNGNYTLYQYDAFGNKTDVIKMKAGYGANIDPAAYVPVPGEILSWTKNSYDTYGNPLVIKQIRDFTTLVGPTVEFDYTDTANNVNGINTTSITRCGDRDGGGTIQRPAECDTETLAYDNLGRLKSGIDGNWYRVDYNYDAVDRVVQSTDGEGNLRDISFDENGNNINQKLVLDKNGIPTLLDQTGSVYDLSDRPITSIDAGGSVTHFSYDAAGNIASFTNPDGYTIAFDYDENNRVVAAYDEEGHSVKRELDIIGRIRTLTDPNGNTSTFEYYGSVQEGRLKRQYDPVGRYTEFDYDANGNVTWLTVAEPGGASQRRTYNEYDELNRVVRVAGPVYVDPVYGIIRPLTKYEYDNLGNQTRVLAGHTDSTGVNPLSDNVLPQEISTYDDLGRVLTTTDALSNTWQYEYDIHGNAKKITDPKNQITEYTYLYGGRVDVQTVYSYFGDPAPHITDYDYDDLGQLSRVTSPEVGYSYYYDDAHRLVAVLDSRSNKRIQYEYSPGGQLNAMVDTEGYQTDYLYDPVGRLTGIWAENGDLVSFMRDAGGRLKQKWFSNGVSSTYEYNTDDTLAQIVNHGDAGQIISQHDYGYDGFGSRETHLERIRNLTLNYKYDYDPLNRLIAVRDADNANSLVEGYAYDRFDNRSTVTSATGAVQAYVYDDAQQLKQIRQDSTTGALLTSYSYDNNGNLTARDENGELTTLIYDALDRTIKVDKTGLATEQYKYDHQGRRIEKTVGSSITRFRYAGPDIIAEYGSDWTQADAVYTHGPAWDEPLIRSTNGIGEYYHQDGLGSVVTVTDMTGAELGTARYNAWGKVNVSTGTINRYGYTGREHDATGLLYYRARYYDPSVGRFTQRDPKGFIDGINRYAYAINNPVNYTDPRGTSVFNSSLSNSVTQSTSYFGTSTSTNYNLGSGSGAGGLSSSSQSLQAAPSSSLGSAAKEFALGFVPGYDLYQAFNNPDAGFTDYAIGVLGVFPGVGKAAGLGLKGGRAVVNGVTKNTVGELRTAGMKDAHHIIQDAAAKNLPGYNTNKAPGVQLAGPANKVGTPHNLATAVQRQAGGGTYAAERRIGYKALRKAGISRQDTRQYIQQSDDYFGGLGVTGSTPMRTVRNRRGSR